MKRNLTNFQKNQLKEKGITLVALVITIVVLIILSSVTISTVFGDNGLINSAKKTKNSELDKVDKEEQNMNHIVQEYANTMAEEKEIPQPNKTIADIVGGEFVVDNTSIGDDYGNIVWIPRGFRVANDSGTKVEEGIVIEDSKRKSVCVDTSGNI